MNELSSLDERQRKSRWIRKSRFCTICFLVLGVILIIAASLSPYTCSEIMWGKA